MRKEIKKILNDELIILTLSFGLLFILAFAGIRFIDYQFIKKPLYKITYNTTEYLCHDCRTYRSPVLSFIDLKTKSGIVLSGNYKKTIIGSYTDAEIIKKYNFNLKWYNY